MNSIREVRRHLLALALAGISALSTSCSVIHSCPGDICVTPDREANFVRESFSVPGRDEPYPVWVTKEGSRPFLQLPALGGVDPCTLEYAVAMSKKGWKVYTPALWIDPQDRDAHGYAMCDVKDSMDEIKKSKRWHTKSRDSAGPILDDVRAMARWVSKREGGQRVVVHGNCLTGIFPLALLNESCVSTAVLCQPATPLMSTPQVLFRCQPKKNREALGLSKDDIDHAIEVLRSDPTKKLLGFHYRHDPMAAYEKFEVIHQHLVDAGDRLSERFQPFILYPVKGTKVETWWSKNSRTTNAKGGMTLPHSTVTSAENECEREWFRDQLAAALR